MSEITEIVVATRNKKKITEIERMLVGLPVTLRSLDDFPTAPEVEEDADTFLGNALKKAHTIARHTGLWALADDSGIEADALGLAPGVYSARYAGPTATDQDNVARLLRELSNTPDHARTARFRCVLALTSPEGEEFVFEGKVEGRLGHSPKGSSGFGYDPIFYPEGHDRTFAEMSGQEKDSISHRGRALALFTTHIRKRTRQ